MSIKSVTSLQLDLKPSQLYEKITLGIHLLALAAGLANALPVALRALIAGAVVISLILTLKSNRAVLQSLELRYSEAGGWNLIIDGVMQPIELLASTLSISILIVLHYRIEGRRSLCTLMIFSDAVDDEQYRKLKVALRVIAGS